MRKTILFMVPHIYPCKTGGIEIFHYYFLQHIKKHYDVLLWTACDKTGLDADITVLRFPPRMLGNQTIAKSYYQWKHITEFKDRIDLIHLPYSSKGVFRDFPILPSAKLFRIPYILRIHGGGMHPGRPVWYHQRLFEGAAGIMAVSSPIKKEYESRHNRPITLIPSMLPFQRDPRSPALLKRLYQLPPDDTAILFLGSIKEIKGPEALLDAFIALGPETLGKHRARLVFAGDGPLMASLQARTEASGLGGRITFLGRVAHEKVCELYKLADLFVIPSLMEARPLTLSEAFFNGVPAIGSDIATIANIIDNTENGLLFRKGDAYDLAAKIRFMLENPEQRLLFGERAGEHYRSMYQYQTMLDDYVKFYEAAMGNRGARNPELEPHEAVR